MDRFAIETKMGHWGVKSYEVDEAADALDAGFDKVHGARYEELMDDRNPLTFDQVQKQLANPATLVAALDALVREFGADLEAWGEVARLALVGVVVRHAECRVAIPTEIRLRASTWLENEEIDWPEATLRRLRRQREIELLSRA
jgi:hypothetical protein